MYTRKQIADARKLAKQHGVNRLLSDPQANPKTKKGEKLLGILTAPLHLAPANMSGYQVCPRASAACKKLCLHTAGCPVYLEGKTRARIARTRFFFEHREAFMTLLWAELRLHTLRAAEKNMFAGIRLNATSDIAWEIHRFADGKTIFETFPDISFYDYTKVEKRMNKFLKGQFPRNYYLTWSATEDNWPMCLSVLRLGGTVAMAFATRRTETLPLHYKGYPVVNGDLHDYRPSDPVGCIIGLRAKGLAIGDTSGFVRPGN